MKRPVILIAALWVAGCSAPSLQGLFAPAQPEAVPVDAVVPPPPEVATETLDPTPPPPPPPAANTVAEFDTTTAEDRAEALAVEEPAGEATLGTTQATLGSPADPGIWLKTPLVSTLTAGRVEYQGASINIELRPSGGEAGSGSQISLPAMRLLNAPLTGIIELTVFAG